LCLACGARIAESHLLCSECRFGDPTIYEGSVKSLFAAAKFGQRPRAIRFFIETAEISLANHIARKTVFLAVPSRSQFLSTVLSRIVPRDLLCLDAFYFNRSKSANKELSETARYKRICENLQWADAKICKANQYLVCDDVATTGATLSHATNLARLNLSGAEVESWALVTRPRYFRTPRQ